MAKYEPDVSFNLEVSLSNTVKNQAQLTEITSRVQQAVTEIAKDVCGFDPMSLHVCCSVDYPSPLFTIGGKRLK